LLRPLVDLPAYDLVRPWRAHVVALRRPHHPFAVLAIEQADDQLARLEVPQADGLVRAARDEEAPVGREGQVAHLSVVTGKLAGRPSVHAVGRYSRVADKDLLAVGREGDGGLPAGIVT